MNVESIDKMSEGQFRIFCPKAIENLGYQSIDRKDEKNQPYRYVVFALKNNYSNRRNY